MVNCLPLSTPPMCRLYSSTTFGFRMTSTPSSVSLVRRLFSMNVSSWNVLSISTSLLSFHFIKSMESSRLKWLSPFLSFADRMSSGMPCLLDLIVQHASNLSSRRSLNNAGLV